MSQYGMSNKSGKELISKTIADDLPSAYIYFAKLKNMPLGKFKKIFVVVEL
jgi:hypothetical protein|tara:strand:- start:236 stop:388 length:153 start_codon:yes stop_codon:yes gene_type:complete